MILHPPNARRYLRGLPAGVILLGIASSPVAGATGDPASLPRPAGVAVDFVRDIQPILDRSCLRCHGPERPKSGFRLDSREGALQGGAIGVSLLVSNSAASPLIHYVARLPDVPEDLWMPPEGKAPPLSAEEVALFRAWVDQGIPWTTGKPPAQLNLELAPTVGGTAVHGNESVFREHRWTPDGWNGGLERFELRQELDAQTRIRAEGRALRDDYRVTLELDRRDLGFVRTGFDRYRKYYSDSGGYFSAFAPPIFALDRDLHLDLGHAWLEVGLTLPRWPRLTLGYDHHYQEGEKSLTSWSPVTQGGVTRNLFPTSKAVDLETHGLKFNLDHEQYGVRIENDLRVEWTESHTSRTNVVLNPSESDSLFLDQVRESQDGFQAANALRVERQFAPWFFGSAGYLYSHCDADASFALDETYVSGTPGFAQRWRSPSIMLERNANVGNLNGQLGPWDGFTVALGVQSEWNRQHGFGDASFDFEQAGGGFFLRPTTQESAIDRTTVTEHLGLRYTKIPRTVLFAEARLQQESLSQFEEQPGGEAPLRRDTDTSAEVFDFRGGLTTSPWRPLSFSSSYRWIQKQTRYDHWLDVVPSPFGDFLGEGYSAFIRDRETVTDEVEARLAYRWSPWLKTTLSYRLVASDYWTSTDPVLGYDPVTFEPIPGYLAPGTRLLAGNYDTHIYSLNAGLRPAKGLNVNTTFSFHDTRTASAANDAASVAAYRGHTYSVLLTATYAWNAKTELRMNYAYSHADYDQDPAPDSLPLGVVYRQHGFMTGLRRRLSDRINATLRYGFFLYDEPSSGGFNDYTAQMVYATLSFRLP